MYVYISCVIIFLVCLFLWNKFGAEYNKIPFQNATIISLTSLAGLSVVFVFFFGLWLLGGILAIYKSKAVSGILAKINKVFM